MLHLLHGEANSILNQNELELLTDAWITWGSSGRTPGRALAHARLFLVFLLIRYGGLRLGEINLLKIENHLDTDTGMLYVPGDFKRKIMLSPVALRKIREIAKLKEAAESDFLKIDSGFIRRAFYKRAEEAGIEKEKAGPRALRFARGVEMFRQHMSVNTIQEYLGLKTQTQIMTFFKSFNNINESATPSTDTTNRFMSLVTGITPCHSKVSLSLLTFNNLSLNVLCSFEKFVRLEPGLNKIVITTLSPEQIFIFFNPPSGLFSNSLPATIKSIIMDQTESRISLEAGEGACLSVLTSRSYLANCGFKTGDNIFACFTSYSPTINLP